MGPRPTRLRPPAYARPPDDRPVYVRFVCFQMVRGHRSRLGLFQAMDLARSSDQSSGWALDAIRELSRWFDKNLAVPTEFRRASLSWFKPSAVEHVSRMYHLKAALEECGVHVDVLTTREPGVVIYEDEHQLTAEPKGRF